MRWRYAGMLPLLVYFQFKAMFDGMGWTRIGMQTGIGMNLLNALLNWVLIFGKLGAPAMGVKGAALASSLSSLLAALAILALALRPHGAPVASGCCGRARSGRIWCGRS